MLSQNVVRVRIEVDLLIDGEVVRYTAEGNPVTGCQIELDPVFNDHRLSAQTEAAGTLIPRLLDAVDVRTHMRLAGKVRLDVRSS